MIKEIDRLNSEKDEELQSLGDVAQDKFQRDLGSASTRHKNELEKARVEAVDDVEGTGAAVTPEDIAQEEDLKTKEGTSLLQVYKKKENDLLVAIENAIAGDDVEKRREAEDKLKLAQEKIRKEKVFLGKDVD